MPTKADQYLNKAYSHLNLSGKSDTDKYNHIDSIVNHLNQVNNMSLIPVGSTGTISERLCRLALNATFPKHHNKITGHNWKWLGDFAVWGNPFNLLISVKSFKAKERLLISGSGGILTPTVGWGLFNDPAEWGEQRVKSYLYRCFIAIYMPRSTYNQLSPEAKDVENVNGLRLLRPLDQFITDLQNNKVGDQVDIRSF